MYINCITVRVQIANITVIFSINHSNNKISFTAGTYVVLIVECVYVVCYMCIDCVYNSCVHSLYIRSVKNPIFTHSTLVPLTIENGLMY